MLLSLCPSGARGQGGFYQNIAFRQLPSGIQVSPGATVTVCAATATIPSGGVCLPAESDANCCFINPTLTTAQPGNPWTADAGGNYFFWATPGNYIVCISGNGAVPYCNNPVQVPCPPGGTGCGSSGGGGTPGGTNLQGQFNNAGTSFGGTSCFNLSTLTGPLNFDCDTHAAGPTPLFDLARYGGYLGGLTPPTITCTTNGTTTMSCGGGISDFLIGHGVAIPTAGIAPVMATPSGGTVTPVGILNGATTYNYKVVAIGYHGELSAASAAFTTTTGASALGLTTAIIATNGCVESNGVVTFTTTAAHNFQALQSVNIPRGTTGTTAVEGAWTIASVPTGNTFTINIATLGNGTFCPSGGTAQVMAKNVIKWTMEPYQVMGAYIYRQIGAGSFTLAGSQAGMDSSWIDWGFTAPPVPAYVPSTPPASVTNGVFATTITGISGTNVTLAAAPTQSVSGATVFHDNTANVLKICASSLFSNSTAGGEIYLSPSAPQGSVYVFNSPLNMESGCPEQTKLVFGAQAVVNYPITPNSSNIFEGAIQAGGGNGANPSFLQYYTARILGNAMPMFLVEVGTFDITFKNLQTQCLNNYQTCFYQDQDSTGNNVTTITYDNVYMIGGNRAQTFKMGGGFNFFFKGGAIGNSPLAWGVPPALWDVPNIGAGNSQQQQVGIVDFEYTNMGGSEWLFDAEGISLGTGGAGDIIFNNSLDESSFYPSIRFMESGNAGNVVANVTINRISYSDPVGGLSTPIVDITGTPSISNFTVNEPLCATGTQAFFSGSAVSGIEFKSGERGCGVGLPSTAQIIFTDLERNGFMERVYENVPASASGTGSFFYPTAAPAAPASAAVSAGGSVPVGLHTYALVGIDPNGGETTLGPSISATTTTGNQTVTITPPTVPPRGIVAYGVWRDGLFLANSSFACASFNSIGTTSGTFVDTVASACGNNPPVIGSAGLGGVGAGGVSGFKANVGTLNQTNANGWSGTSACVGGTKAIAFPATVVFTFTPNVFVFDYTTAGGASLSAGPATSGFTVSCTGATDAFSWQATGNPF